MLQLVGGRRAFILKTACVALVATAGTLSAEETSLDRYVAKPDDTFQWKVVKKASGPTGSQFTLDMKSQTWRTEKDLNRTVWQHWVNIVKPAGVKSKTAFLFISGGGNGGDPPSNVDPKMSLIAQTTNTIVAEVKMIPNQPLIFHNDGKGRKEDDLIAYTHDQFLKTGDDTWPARLPMTKSAVRAMDCVQQFLESDEGGNYKVENFVVAGGSKRGWTTWTTAAVDKRVIAAVPIVIDVLNVNASMTHHIHAYGAYSLSVGDYFRHGLTKRMRDPRTNELYKIEDPYSYRDRLTMPKYIVNGSGDQYFLPDSSQFYWDGLKGEKYLRYVQNADHGLDKSDALQSITAFYQTIVSGTPRPKYSWKFQEDGSIRVETPDAPTAVKLWAATNPERRDFRLAVIGPAYKDTLLKEEAKGVYVGKITPPEKGWTAFFIELSYDVGASFPFKVSTAVRVLPDVLPYANVDPAEAVMEKIPKELIERERQRRSKKKD